MPITDYEKLAQKAEQKLFDNDKIPQATKTLLRRFLTAYDVSSARRLIFLQKIVPYFEFFPEIESSLTDRDGVNEFFAGLRRKYAPATYATYINVVRCFMHWLNNGERPSSLCDLRQRGINHKTRRQLQPEDMLSWADGEQLASIATSLQMSAIILTQLDCGFRPSEFIDLNYGDVQIQTGLAIFQVRDGKTGGRSVVAHRCVPALLKWMDAHPTKRANDPLWVSEKATYGSSKGVQVKRYPYPGLVKRLRTLKAKSGIQKPMDFYSFRHSSCVLDKLDNLPTDLAAERHGHSVKHFVGTYGRLSVKDVMRRFHSHYGMDAEQETRQVTHQNCPTCHHVNEPEATWCCRCGTPFNALGAAEMARHQQLTKENPENMHDELKSMRNELLEARRREKLFKKEQMDLLRQVKNVRQAMSQSQELVHRMR